MQKRVQYTLERQAKKDKAPKVDKTPEAWSVRGQRRPLEVPPPFIVVVQGPPGVALVHDLVRFRGCAEALGRRR